MKKYIIMLLCIPFFFSSCLRDLEKEGIKNETIYKGRVIDAKNKPLNGIMVRITNGSLIYNSVTTDKDGIFQITVDVSKIDKSYYIQVGEEGSLVKRSSLKGFGQDVYDYGDIPFVNINLPEVETIGLTAMTESSFICKCNVKSKGGAIVTERGLCWSTNIPTIDDHKEKFGSGEGIYSCEVKNLNISTTTYYARAYAINEYGVGYGEPVEVNSSRMAYFSLPTMEYGGYTYRIHPDMGGMTWNQAFDGCENLIAYGYEDWYLPNKEEMYAVAEKTNVLNKSYIYWTSDKGSDTYYAFWYDEEDQDWDSYNYYYHSYGNPIYGRYINRVIPVRKDR